MREIVLRTVVYAGLLADKPWIEGIRRVHLLDIADALDRQAMNYRASPLCVCFGRDVPDDGFADAHDPSMPVCKACLDTAIWLASQEPARNRLVLEDGRPLFLGERELRPNLVGAVKSTARRERPSPLSTSAQRKLRQLI